MDEDEVEMDDGSDPSIKRRRKRNDGIYGSPMKRRRTTEEEGEMPEPVMIYDVRNDDLRTYQAQTSLDFMKNESQLQHDPNFKYNPVVYQDMVLFKQRMALNPTFRMLWPKDLKDVDYMIPNIIGMHPFSRGEDEEEEMGESERGKCRFWRKNPLLEESTGSRVVDESQMQQFEIIEIYQPLKYGGAGFIDPEHLDPSLKWSTFNNVHKFFPAGEDGVRMRIFNHLGQPFPITLRKLHNTLNTRHELV